MEGRRTKGMREGEGWKEGGTEDTLCVNDTCLY